MYKARVVVRNWGQVPGSDCCSTFAPICKLRSICVVLAVVAEYDLECWQIDHNTAFPSAELKEEVYVKMVAGYEEFDANGTPILMRLHNSLYVLRQISHC